MLYKIFSVTKSFLFLIIVILIFTFVGIASINYYGREYFLGSITEFDNDDVKYLRSAQTFLDTGMLTYNDPAKPTVFIMPGITLLLSLFVDVNGIIDGAFYFRIFQMFLQCINLALVFFIAKKVFNTFVAVCSITISIFYLADYFAMNIVLTEVVFKTLLLLLCYTTMIAFEKRMRRYYILPGAIFSVAVLFRPAIALFPVIVLLIWIIKRYTVKEMIRYAGTVFVILCIFLVPWWVRNYKQFNRFIPLTLSTGNPMLQGTYINYEKNPEEERLINYGKFHYSPTGDELVNNQVELDIARERLAILVPRDIKGYAYWYTVGKTIMQWKRPFIFENPFNIDMSVSVIIHLAIVFSFILGFFISLFSKGNGYSFFIFAVIFYFNAVHLPYYSFPRYIYPVMPLVIIFASFLVFKVFKVLKLTSDEG